MCKPAGRESDDVRVLMCAEWTTMLGGDTKEMNGRLARTITLTRAGRGERLLETVRAAEINITGGVRSAAERPW